MRDSLADKRLGLRHVAVILGRGYEVSQREEHAKRSRIEAEACAARRLRSNALPGNLDNSLHLLDLRLRDHELETVPGARLY
jgi:hypothetical protein